MLRWSGRRLRAIRAFTLRLVRRESRPVRLRLRRDGSLLVRRGDRLWLIRPDGALTRLVPFRQRPARRR